MEMVTLAVVIAMLIPSSYSWHAGKLELGLPCGFKIGEYILTRLLSMRSSPITAPKDKLVEEIRARSGDE